MKKLLIKLVQLKSLFQFFSHWKYSLPKMPNTGNYSDINPARHSHRLVQNLNAGSSAVPVETGTQTWKLQKGDSVELPQISRNSKFSSGKRDCRFQSIQRQTHDTRWEDWFQSYRIAENCLVLKMQPFKSQFEFLHIEHILCLKCPILGMRVIPSRPGILRDLFKIWNQEAARSQFRQEHIFENDRK